MHYRTSPYFTYALCSLLYLIACGTLSSAATPDLDDLDITLAVETELLVDPSVPSHKIDVSTEGGIVTLSGSVDRYVAKLEAEDAAESVKGVLAVVNEIVATPVIRTDAQIRSDIISELILDPVAELFEIDVNVKDGVVTLDGAVDSYAEKRIAEQIAQNVKGVIDVRNELTYDIVDDRSDIEIKNDVEARLRWDASIDSGLITVAVDDGDVTLDGSAASSFETTEAESEAWMVPGVKSVTNNIDVEWWLDGETADWDPEWTDADMREAIEDALLTNTRVKSFNVVTAVANGVATLTGTVDNLEAKKAAEEEAQDVLGIRRVKNFLRVRPAVERTDVEIANNVRDALRRDPYVDRYEIAVSVYNGKVYLTGDVDSWYMKNQAENAAIGVLGVVDVQNNLDVDYDYAGKTDQEIKEDIDSQLYWSPFVDSDDITVVVNSGVATLMGTVSDWDEVQSAKVNALQGGATSVISKLDVENGFGVVD